MSSPPRGRRIRIVFAALAAVAFPSLAYGLPFWLRLPENVSTYGGQIDDLFRLILWITGTIFVLVEGLLLFFLFRYRHREGRVPRYTHGSNRLEVFWTIVPAVICVILALMSRRSWAEIKQSIPREARNSSRGTSAIRGRTESSRPRMTS